MNVRDFLILMVEDDPNEVLLTKRALERANLVNPLRVVSTGENAIAYLSGKPRSCDPRENTLPSLILLDLKLPGMGGLQFLEWLRRQDSLKDITVVIVTASINPKDRQKATELGVSAYLCKPVDTAGLLEMMKSIGMCWMILRKNSESSVQKSTLSGCSDVASEESSAVALGPPDEVSDPQPDRRGGIRNDTEILGDQVRFQKTSWELVRSAREPRAMDELIRIYWKPLYYFIRQKGFDNEAAKDLVQDFLADVLERNTIAKADPVRGKFRTFLLAALSNFIKDWHKASARLKRGGGRFMYSLDFNAGERQYALEVASGETPETVLNRAWARSTLEECISELAGNPTHLQAFRMMLQGSRYSEISKETGLTESAAKAAVCRLRQQLRDEVLRRLGRMEQWPDPEEIDIADVASLLLR